MAHASRMEACKNRLKRLRAQRAKDRHEKALKLAEMSDEERAELEKRQNTKTLGEQINLMNWDFQQNQLSRLKYPKFRQLLEEYLKDLKVGSVEWHRINKILEQVKKK